MASTDCRQIKLPIDLEGHSTKQKQRGGQTFSWTAYSAKPRPCLSPLYHLMSSVMWCAFINYQFLHLLILSNTLHCPRMIGVMNYFYDVSIII